MKILKISLSSEINNNLLKKIKSLLKTKKYKFNKINIKSNNLKIFRKLEKTDVFITKYYKIPQDFFLKKNQLKLMHLTTSDYSFIDLNFFRKKKIIIKNNQGANSVSVAEHIFLLMLSIIRNFLDQVIIKNKIWKNLKHKNQELYNKNIGIIGMGNVGFELAKRCVSFGMHVAYYDIKRKNLHFEKKNKIKFVNLIKLFQNSDFISVNTNLTKSSDNLINKKYLKLMKKNSILINTSRGRVLNEDDLYKILKSKKIYYSALDVFNQEPLPQNSKLRKLNNIIMTPHCGPSKETVDKLSKIIATNIESIYYKRKIKSLK